MDEQQQQQQHDDLSKILASLEAEIETTKDALKEASKENESNSNSSNSSSSSSSNNGTSEGRRGEDKEGAGENMDATKIETIRELINRIKAIDAEIADLEAPVSPISSAVLLAQSFSATEKNETFKTSLSESIDIFASDPEFTFDDIPPSNETTATTAAGSMQGLSTTATPQTVILRSAEQALSLAASGPSSDVADVIDSYRATLGLCAAGSFKERPENAILVANTLRYLSASVVHMAAERDEKQGPLFELALALDAAAERIVGDEVAARGKSLCGFFEANEKNFGHKWDREKITAVESSIHFTIQMAEDYTRRWAEVTPDPHALVALVDALLLIVGSETIKKVETMGDISAKESTNVSRVLGLVLPMGPALRKICGPEFKDSLPPVWHKLAVLMALMDMTLVKIHEGIDAKDFVEFGQDELISLVEHLFTESEKRAALIARIKKDGFN